MFFQGVSSVHLLDRSGNDMLCSILFLSLGFDVLADYFNWCPSCRQKAETLAPECMHMVNIMIPFLQNNPISGSNIFPYFFCSFWNWIIDNFSSIFYHHNQMIIHQIYRMCIVICFFHKISPFFEYLFYRLILLYHGLRRRTSVLFTFMQFISHL